MVVITFPIIIVHKHCKQDDGDNLQNQGHDGELHPHVGGVRRHPETNSGVSRSPSLCLTVPRYQPCLGVVLCEGREESGFKLM